MPGGRVECARRHNRGPSRRSKRISLSPPHRGSRGASTKGRSRGAICCAAGWRRESAFLPRRAVFRAAALVACRVYRQSAPIGSRRRAGAVGTTGHARRPIRRDLAHCTRLPVTCPEMEPIAARVRSTRPAGELRRNLVDLADMSVVDADIDIHVIGTACKPLRDCPLNHKEIARRGQWLVTAIVSGGHSRVCITITDSTSRVPGPNPSRRRRPAGRASGPISLAGSKIDGRNAGLACACRRRCPRRVAWPCWYPNHVVTWANRTRVDVDAGAGNVDLPPLGAIRRSRNRRLATMSRRGHGHDRRAIGRVADRRTHGGLAAIAVVAGRGDDQGAERQGRRAMFSKTVDGFCPGMTVPSDIEITRQPFEWPN